ncbi:hypothetical protein FBY35_1552 [Streptomyces sp. SLBN-118]|nr:hypothetical protein FBY35_1552 [Streptomyces sp. SLBN-118]
MGDHEAPPHGVSVWIHNVREWPKRGGRTGDAAYGTAGSGTAADSAGNSPGPWACSGVPRRPENRLTPLTACGHRCLVPGGGVKALCRAPVREQEVRTVMTVAALGAAQVQKIIIPTPVVSG